MPPIALPSRKTVFHTLGFNTRTAYSRTRGIVSSPTLYLIPYTLDDSTMPFSGQAFTFTFRCAPPGPSRRKDDDDALCDECAKLDLEQSFASAFDLYDGARRGTNTRPLAACRQGNGPVYLKDFYYVASLGDRLSRKKDCKLCDFLEQMTAEPAKGTYKLLAFCSSESYLFEAQKKDV
jgi:hypothetical protein